MLLAIAGIASTPILTQVFTITLNEQQGSIVVSTSAPSGSQIFEEENEVLASITSFNYNYGSVMLSIGMTTVSSTNQIEKPYQMDVPSFSQSLSRY